MKLSKPKYLEQALLLSPEEQERVLSRMSGKLPRRLEKDRLSVDEAIAIQLEIEDEQLNEWRERMHALKKASSKPETKTKAASKTKPEAKADADTPAEAPTPAAAKPVKKPTATKPKAASAKAPAAAKAPVTAKAPAAPKAPAKAKAPAKPKPTPAE